MLLRCVPMFEWFPIKSLLHTITQEEYQNHQSAVNSLNSKDREQIQKNKVTTITGMNMDHAKQQLVALGFSSNVLDDLQILKHGDTIKRTIKARCFVQNADGTGPVTIGTIGGDNVEEIETLEDDIPETIYSEITTNYTENVEKPIFQQDILDDSVDLFQSILNSEN